MNSFRPLQGCLRLGVLLLAALAVRPSPAAEAPAHVLDRIAIVGASLSGGFGAPPGWRAAFEATCEHPPKVVVESSTALFFVQPGSTGRRLAGEAAKALPSLVLAVDFPFWFGYGRLGFDGRKLPSDEARLTLLDQGLALLEPFRCPVVIGDFPDMSSAVGGILTAEQMPGPDTLKALNRRLGAWADAHTNVIVLPIADWIARIHGHETVRIGRLRFGPERTARWLQPDRLHPTLEGLVALAVLAQDSLVTRGWAVAGDFTTDPARFAPRLELAREAAESAAYSEEAEQVRRRVSSAPADEAARWTALEAGFRQLQARYPRRPEVYAELLKIAEHLPPEASRALHLRFEAWPAPEDAKRKAAAMRASPESAGTPSKPSGAD